METIIGLHDQDYQRFKTYFGLKVFIPSTESLDDRPGYERDLAVMNTLRNEAGNKRRLAAVRLGARLHRSTEMFPALRAQDTKRNTVIIDNRTTPGSTFGALTAASGAPIVIYNLHNTVVLDDSGLRSLPARAA